MPSVSFLPFLQTVPWGTRALTALVIVSSLSYYAAAHYVARGAATPPSPSDILPWVVLTPAVSWKYPWTLLTAGFVEITWIEVRTRLSGLLLTISVDSLSRNGTTRMSIFGASLGSVRTSSLYLDSYRWLQRDCVRILLDRVYPDPIRGGYVRPGMLL